MSKIKNIQGNNDNYNQNFKYVPTVQIYIIMNKKLSKMISTLFVYRIRIETFSQQCVCPKRISHLKFYQKHFCNINLFFFLFADTYSTFSRENV